MTRSEALKMTDRELDKAIKIQGTRFDRKRKISNYTLYRMRTMFEKGVSVSDIARKLNLNYNTVRYNVDPQYKEEYNRKRDGKHCGHTNITPEDRASYKREIIATRKMRTFA